MRKSPFITSAGDCGAISVPMLLGVAGLHFACLAGLAGLEEWKRQIRTQFRIDDCVAQAVRQIRGILKSVEASNTRLTLARNGFRLAITPETKAAFALQVRAEVFFQTAQTMNWNRLRMGVLGCRNPRDTWIPGPAFPWIRDPPDDAGAGVLRWKDEMAENPTSETRREFHFEVSSGSRKAASKVFKENQKWKLKWARPKNTVNLDKLFSRPFYGHP